MNGTRIHELQALVRRHQGGVLLDTNLVLLHVMLETDEGAVSEWKRISHFPPVYSSLLRLVTSEAKTLVSTPHILAEVCNFAEKAPERVRRSYWSNLEHYIRACRERFFRARDVARHPAFARLGLTDVAQLMFGTLRRPLVVTVDAALSVLLEHEGRPYINLANVVFPAS